MPPAPRLDKVISPPTPLPAPLSAIREPFTIIAPVAARVRLPPLALAKPELSTPLTSSVPFIVSVPLPLPPFAIPAVKLMVAPSPCCVTALSPAGLTCIPPPELTAMLLAPKNEPLVDIDICAAPVPMITLLPLLGLALYAVIAAVPAVPMPSPLAETARLAALLLPFAPEIALPTSVIEPPDPPLPLKAFELITLELLPLERRIAPCPAFKLIELPLIPLAEIATFPLNNIPFPATTLIEPALDGPKPPPPCESLLITPLLVKSPPAVTLILPPFPAAKPDC